MLMTQEAIKKHANRCIYVLRREYSQVCRVYSAFHRWRQGEGRAEAVGLIAPLVQKVLQIEDGEEPVLDAEGYVGWWGTIQVAHQVDGFVEGVEHDAAILTMGEMRFEFLAELGREFTVGIVIQLGEKMLAVG